MFRPANLTDTRDALSEQDLDEIVEGLREKVVPQNEDIDLERYQMREHQTKSMAERFSERVLEVVGYTPQRRFAKRLVQAKELDELYAQKVDELEKRFNTVTQSYSDARTQHVDREEYFAHTQTQYERKTSRVEQIEAELEVLIRNHPQTSSMDMYEKRETLTDAKKDQLTVRRDADQAMILYERTKSTLTVLEAQVERIEHQLHSVQTQRTAYSLKILDWENQQQVAFGDQHSPSLRSLYEEIGIRTQQMNTFIEEVTGSHTESLFDQHYAVRIGNPQEDELVQKWLKARSV